MEDTNNYQCARTCDSGQQPYTSVTRLQHSRLYNKDWLQLTTILTTIDYHLLCMDELKKYGVTNKPPHSSSRFIH